MEPSEEDILEVRQRAIEKIESPDQGNFKINHHKWTYHHNDLNLQIYSQLLTQRILRG